MRKKFLAALLTLTMIVSLVPPTAFAENASVSQEQTFEEDSSSDNSSNEHEESSSEVSDTEQSDTNDNEGEEISSSESSSSENSRGGVDSDNSDETEKIGDSENDGSENFEEIDKSEQGISSAVSSEETKEPTVFENTEEVGKYGLPKEERMLTDILGTDEDGNPKIYTTLYDSQKRVVSTNDPYEEEDDYYKNGGTVGLNDVIYVHFDMDEIIPNDGENGVQENVTYVLPNLPNEFLIPAEKDENGNQMLNPETPVEFFQTNGDIQSCGGIYGTTNNYELKVFFKNVEENIDISGVFHYGATVSDSLIPGEEYTIDNVPGGSVSFTVTPNKYIPSAGGYSFSLSGGQGGPTSYYWTANIFTDRTTSEADEDSEETPILPYNTLNISTDDAMGVWVKEDSFDIFTAYGDGTGPGLSAGVTYTTKDENDNNKNEFITSTKNDIIENSDGITTVRLKGKKEDLQIDIQFKREDAVEDTISQYNGIYSYITNKIYVKISGTDGKAAKNIRAITLYVPTITYDDYEHMGNFGYTGTAELSYDGENILSATGSVTATYGGLKSPSLYDDADRSSLYSSYEFFPYSAYAYVNSNSTGYRGNYYWVDFDPVESSSGDVNYYISNRSFLPGNSLASSNNNGREATFSTQNAGTGLVGMVGSFDWQFIGTVSTAQIAGDHNLIANSCFASGGSTGDAKLQYQLKKVFGNYNGNGNLVVYRSTQPHDYGEYMYIIIDPQTYDTAQKSNFNGWYEMMEYDNASAKPAGWRIHIFNAPCSAFFGSMFQSPGALKADDKNSSWSVTGKAQTGIFGNDYTPQSVKTTFSGSKWTSSVLDSRWVNDDTIFWTFKFNASNWPKFNSGYLYAKTDKTLQPQTSGSTVVDGDKLYFNSVYVSNNGKWSTLYTPSAGSGNTFYGDGSINILRPETSLTSSYYDDQTLYFNFTDSNMTQYRDREGNITVGFFTKVKGTPNHNYSDDRYYKCDAEIIAQTGDISRFAGSDGNSFPENSEGFYNQYPLRITATGYAGVPELTKNSSAVESDSTKTVTNWTIQPKFADSVPYGHTSSPLISDYYGGYSGTLNIYDSMADASAEDVYGDPVSISPGEYTHITKMMLNGFNIGEYGNGGSCGPIPYEDAESDNGYSGDTSWQYYKNGQWYNTGKDDKDEYHLWNPTEQGIYRCILTTSGTNTENNPLAVYVYYAGNMADSIQSVLSSELSDLDLNPSDKRFEKSLVVEYRGLAHAYADSIRTPISYITEVSNTDILDAANKATDKTGESGLSALYDLSLSNEAGCGIWNYFGKEPVNSTVEKRLAALLSIKKTANVINKNVGGNAYTGSYKLETVNGLTPSEYIDVEDFISSFANVERAAGDSIAAIENGTFESDEAVKELLKHLTLEDNINIQALVNGKLYDTVYENGAFTSNWTESEFSTPADSDYSSEKAGSLFKVRIKMNDEQIPAGMEFVINYRTTIDMDNPAQGETTAFRDSKYYLGSGLQIFNNAVAERTYTSSVAENSMARTSGENKTLTVDCGGNVGSVYLMKNKLVKDNVSSTNDTMHWLYYTYTGTMGKDGVDVPLDDYLRYEVQDNFTFTDADTNEKTALKDVPEAEQNRIKLLFEHLVERHTTYKNIKLYYTDTQPDNSGTNLSDDDLIWDLGELTVSGGTEVLSGKATKDGLKNLAVGATPSTASDVLNGTGKFEGIKLTLNASPATLVLQPNGEIDHTHIGFRVSAEGLDYQKYFVSTYDISVDWDAVAADAKKVFGNYGSQGGFVNEISDDTGEKADSKGNIVTVEDATFKKSVSGVNASEGKADWTLTVSTGSKQEDTIKIEDTVEADLPDGTEERVKTAADAATYIDPSSVTIKFNAGGHTLTSIYSNSAATADWKDNIEVAVDGRHIEVTIKNTEDSRKIDKGQMYMVTYTTKLDKNTFLEKGGKTQDTYLLKNSAVLSYGDMNLISSANGTFKPTAPITAEKKCDGVNDNVATWTAKATTGIGVRKDFTLKDTMTSSDEKAISSMRLQDISIEVKTGDEDSVVYTLDTLPEGVKITDSKGKKLELDKLGFDGFVLSFDELPANTTVSVHYSTAIDRDAYGKDGSIYLKNALNASSADGATAGDNKSSSVTVKKPLEKAGKVETIDDKPFITWTVKTNLTEKFSQTDLNKLDEVTIKDSISPVLKLDMSSVTVKDSAGNSISSVTEQIGTTLIVHIKNPAQTPNIVITFKTECIAGVSGLVNDAEMEVDGKIIEKAQSPDIGKIKVSKQYGTIQSAKTPSFEPTAFKYVDNVLCTTADKYKFTLTETDENGIPLENAYTETKGNDSEGKITFSEIKYKTEEPHYYKIAETGKGVLDTREFLIKVELVKATVGYIVKSTVISPENYDVVRFDNTTKPKTTDFTVSKVWNDKDNVSGLRPEEILVYLYQGDKPYNNTAVKLNKDNNWTYTWENLPVAGGEYRAVEEPVEGYDSTYKTSDGKTVITNTANAGQLTISKTVAGSQGDVNRDFTFTVTFKSADGTPLTQRFNYEGSKSGTIANGEQITLKHNESITVKNIPDGTVYSVEEEKAEGYDTTVTDGTGQIKAAEKQTAAFVNTKGGSDTGDGKLTIKKSVTGNNGDHSRLFTFIITLKDEEGRPLSGSYPYDGSKSGTVASGEQIQLKDGEEITVSELPENTQYLVEEVEANQDGYTTSASNVSGTIAAGGSETAEFVNNKDKTTPPPNGGKEDTPETTSLTVEKKWRYSGEVTPEFVLVQLMCDGKAYGEPVRLRKENNWQYTWTDLSKDFRWTAEEIDVPDGYTVSVSYDKTLWTITNTKTDTPDKPDTPNQPEQPNNPNQPIQPETPVIPSKPDDSDTPNNPETDIPSQPTPEGGYKDKIPETDKTDDSTPSESTDTSDKTPKTGDNANPTLYFTLMCIALLGLIKSIIKLRKNQSK